MLHDTHLITYGNFGLLQISNVKKIYRQKTKRFAFMLDSNSFTNKHVYITKSQFLFICEVLKMNFRVKFGKIIRNCQEIQL